VRKLRKLRKLRKFCKLSGWEPLTHLRKKVILGQIMFKYVNQ